MPPTCPTAPLMDGGGTTHALGVPEAENDGPRPQVHPRNFLPDGLLTRPDADQPGVGRVDSTTPDARRHDILCPMTCAGRAVPVSRVRDTPGSACRPHAAADCIVVRGATAMSWQHARRGSDVQPWLLKSGPAVVRELLCVLNERVS